MNDNNDEVIALNVDDAPVHAAVKRANDSVDSYAEKTRRAVLTAGKAFEEGGKAIARGVDRGMTSFELLVKNAERAEKSYSSLSSSVARAAASTEKAYDRVSAAGTKLADGARVAATNITQLTAGVAAGTVVLAGHTIAMEKLVNLWRAARLLISPTLFTAGTTAAGIGVEAVLRNAEAVARGNREASLVAARSGTSFQDVLALQTTNRIEGRDVSGVFAGRSVAEIRGLIAAYSQLKDPVDKAAFAVDNFGDNAERAMPMLRAGLLDSLNAADKLASGVTKLDRESLERLSESMGAIGRKAHEIATGFRAWWETQDSGRQWFAMMAAHTADTIGVGQAPSPNLILGMDQPKEMPSFTDVVQGKATAEATKRAIMMTIPVDSDTLSRSDAAMAKYNSSREGLQGKLSAAESTRLMWRDQLSRAQGVFVAAHYEDKNGAETSFDAPGASFVAGKMVAHPELEQSIRTSYLQSTKEVDGLKAKIAQIDAQADAVKRLEAAEKSLVAFETQLNEKELGPAARFLAQGEAFIGREGLTGNMAERARSAARIAASGELEKEVAEEQKRKDALSRDLAKFSAENQKEFDSAIQSAGDSSIRQGVPFIRTGSRLKQITLQGNLQYEAGVSDRRLRLMSLGAQPGQERSIIDAEYAERMSLATRLHNLEEGYANDLLDIDEKRVALAESSAKKKEAEFAAENEHYLKLAELQRKQADEIKSVAAGLFETLLSKPAEFGRQFLGTIRSAIIKPIAEGLGGIASNVLRPTIFGANGDGGIAGALHGLFGGGSINDVQLVNGAVPVVVVGAGASGGGGIGGYSSAGGTFSRLFGGGPSGGEEIGWGSSQTAGLSQLSSGLWSRGPASGGLGQIAGLGGTGGFSGGYGGPGGSGGGGLGGILGNLGRLKGIDWGGLTRADAGGLPGTNGQPGTDLGNTGSITGVHGLAGAALLTGGMALAQQSLLGSWRGTWGGVAGGAIGGAAIGFQLGGPIGAAIGGAAGGLIGLGEKIAGLETPQREAARLVKQVWGLDISPSSPTVAQIVAIAKQSFGGTISVAVRSPQVRELLQLYADSTGQRSGALAALQVRSASLAESASGLYQTASYLNGSPYTISSSLPTLGPAGTVVSSAAPSGTVMVSLNPQQTVDLWRTGTAQAIQGNPRGIAAANVSGSGQSSARINGASMLLGPSVITA